MPGRGKPNKVLVKHFQRAGDVALVDGADLLALELQDLISDGFVHGSPRQRGARVAMILAAFRAQRVRTAGVIPSPSAPLGLNCARNLVRTRSSHLRDFSSPSAPRNDNLTEFFSTPSKVTAATAAKPAAGASAAAEARSAGATRRGRQDRPGARGHLVHVVDEAHGVKVRTVGAAVPLGRLPIDVLERARPFFLHSQGHCKRQEFLEHLRRLDGARKAVRFHMPEEILEAEDAFERAGAFQGPRGHKPAEAADDSAGCNTREDEGERRDAQQAAEKAPAPTGWGFFFPAIRM